jgi:hypothetical protein
LPLSSIAWISSSYSARERHRPPRLAVQEELDAGVAGRGVDLDDHRRRGEANRFPWCRA